MINILLVDDDQTCNFLSMKALERIGQVNDIHTASNGEEAIDLFNTFYLKSHFLPDIILLDLNMPIMNGFDFLQAFSKLNIDGKEQIKIIVVSSSLNMDDISLAKKLGATDYVPKPLTAERLRGVL